MSNTREHKPVRDRRTKLEILKSVRELLERNDIDRFEMSASADVSEAVHEPFGMVMFEPTGATHYELRVTTVCRKRKQNLKEK